jgi:hypothetical protein
MRALTIQQPWAWAIASGQKPVENRTWRTSYLGRIAIHAGRDTHRLSIMRRLIAQGRDGCAGAWRRSGLELPAESELPFGAIVATAVLVACERVEELPAELRGHAFAEGPWCWRLEDVRPLETPIPCRGKQGLWPVSREILEKLSPSVLRTGQRVPSHRAAGRQEFRAKRARPALQATNNL